MTEQAHMTAAADDLTTRAIFERYEAVRNRFPLTKTTSKLSASALNTTTKVANLIDTQHTASAFVFDAFGVLNVGETLIPGADRRIDELRALGHKIRVLTNAASYPKSGAIEKFQKLGIALAPDEIITSRDATLRYLAAHYGADFGPWGCIAAAEDSLNDIDRPTLRLGHAQADYDTVAGFLFLSTANWTASQQALLQQSLARKARPVLIANADLVAPRDDGFSREPGWFGHALVDRGIDGVEFFGKPFTEVYELAEQTLVGVPPEKIIMCGDTLHTDILGAATRGWQTAFITQDGLFAGHQTDEFCTQSNLHPTWQMPRI